MDAEITKRNYLRVRVEGADGVYIETQSVEANLLFAILQKLEEIRCGLIDIEEK